MKTKQPLLSICIPTYNRARVLKDCLKSIVQADEFSNEVEIVVSDNCSTDDTQQVCKFFTQQYSNIKYYRNDTNVGFCRNFLHVLECGSGTFLKVSNDYNIFRKKSISFLLKKIKKHLKDKPVLYFHNHIGKGKTYETPSFDEFLGFEKLGFGWISNYGYWKEDFDNFENKDTYFHTLFPQIDWFIRSYFKKRTIFCYNEPIVKINNRNEKTGTYNFIEAHAKKFFIPLNELHEKKLISSKSIEETKKQSLYFCTWVMIRRIFGDKRQCRFSTENGWNIIKEEFGAFSWYKSILLKGVVLALIAMPYERTKSFICNFLQK